ncbi:MAG: cytidylate kinase-like family protein [Chloroflexi bacterium]|nr:cytidylate kinase-like family protein [Chloroflexota bacterium]
MITISRQLGSLGNQVAHATARRLGYRVVWREVINQAARRAGAPEVALATIDDLGLLGLRPSTKARRAYHQAVRQIMEELAAEGNVVIVGRAGQVILRGRPDVLHVKVIAPTQLRAQRIADKQGISLEAACAQIEASDRTRRNYLRRYYHVRWDDPELYDLVINTDRISPEIAAELIEMAVSRCLSALPSSTPSSSGDRP